MRQTSFMPPFESFLANGRRTKEVTVSIAVRVGEGPDQGIFSIFLPTPLRTGCATHINAAFCGDMSRTHIEFENAYNRFLVDEAAALAVNVVAHELAGRGDNEALAIVDLLAPLDENDKALDRPWVIGHSGEGIRPHAASAT